MLCGGSRRQKLAQLWQPLRLPEVQSITPMFYLTNTFFPSPFKVYLFAASAAASSAAAPAAATQT